MQGTIIEIRSAEPRQAAALLRENLKTDLVGLFGNRVHVVTKDPDKSIMTAQEILNKAGVMVGSIRTAEPTLEDVFVSVLTEK